MNLDPFSSPAMPNIRFSQDEDGSYSSGTLTKSQFYKVRQILTKIGVLFCVNPTRGYKIILPLCVNPDIVRAFLNEPRAQSPEKEKRPQAEVKAKAEQEVAAPVISPPNSPKAIVRQASPPSPQHAAAPAAANPAVQSPAVPSVEEPKKEPEVDSEDDGSSSGNSDAGASSHEGESKEKAEEQQAQLSQVGMPSARQGAEAAPKQEAEKPQANAAIAIPSSPQASPVQEAAKAAAVAAELLPPVPPHGEQEKKIAQEHRVGLNAPAEDRFHTGEEFFKDLMIVEDLLQTKISWLDQMNGSYSSQRLSEEQLSNMQRLFAKYGLKYEVTVYDLVNFYVSFTREDLDAAIKAKAAQEQKLQAERKEEGEPGHHAGQVSNVTLHMCEKFSRGLRKPLTELNSYEWTHCSGTTIVTSAFLKAKDSDKLARHLSLYAIEFDQEMNGEGLSFFTIDLDAEKNKGRLFVGSALKELLKHDENEKLKQIPIDFPGVTVLWYYNPREECYYSTNVTEDVKEMLIQHLVKEQFTYSVTQEYSRNGDFVVKLPVQPKISKPPLPVEPPQILKATNITWYYNPVEKFYYSDNLAALKRTEIMQKLTFKVNYTVLIHPFGYGAEGGVGLKVPVQPKVPEPVVPKPQQGQADRKEEAERKAVADEQPGNPEAERKAKAAELPKPPGNPAVASGAPVAPQPVDISGFISGLSADDQVKIKSVTWIEKRKGFFETAMGTQEIAAALQKNDMLDVQIDPQPSEKEGKLVISFTQKSSQRYFSREAEADQKLMADQQMVANAAPREGKPKPTLSDITEQEYAKCNDRFPDDDNRYILRYARSKGSHETRQAIQELFGVENKKIEWQIKKKQGNPEILIFFLYNVTDNWKRYYELDAQGAQWILNRVNELEKERFPDLND